MIFVASQMVGANNQGLHLLHHFVQLMDVAVLRILEDGAQQGVGLLLVLLEPLLLDIGQMHVIGLAEETQQSEVANSAVHSIRTLGESVL